MPTVRDIEQALFALAPKELAMSWDNVGQLLGDPDLEVSRVLVALDITEAVADEAIERDCQLIVAHHPVMNCKWLPVQTVRSDTPQGHLLLKLLRSGVSAVCMHTNLDIAEGGVNDRLAQALELIDPGPLGDPEGLCRMGTLAAPMSLEDFAIAAGCDTFVTSDLTYHTFLDAKGKGINLMDAGHFPTEDPVCETLVSYLAAQFPELTVIKSASHREVIQYLVKD